ncbi:MAG: hypothetical protein Q8N23_34720 [Archangium sp.]|nr:hypothetical protein [Archangium sp.]MDP3157876.1 hypothetical protein [Archangium sp.]
MTTEQKAPSAYMRAEAGSRQVVIQIGLGVVAFILGSILSVGASARIGERLGPIESDWGTLAFRWVFERLWLIAVLPVFGYAIGRFTESTPSRFALTAGIAGETFSVLLVTAINGFDYLMEDTAGLIARGLTLFVGMVLTAKAVQVGGEASGEAQLAADLIAEQRKAEYAAFLAAAEGKPAPHPDPLPAAQGEGDKT